MISKPASGCTSVWARVLNVTLEEPIGMELEIEAPQPDANAPRYEYSIDPMVYLAGHSVSLTLCLFVLWMLLRDPVTFERLGVALFCWAVLAFCCYWAIQGIRYGCSVRIFSGYLEVQYLGPMQVIKTADVAHFREFNRYDRTNRRICLYLRSGRKILLPKVHDPDLLWRSLLDDLRIEQAIA